MTDTFAGIREQPRNTLPAITELWAFVSVDPIDGNEGVCAAKMGDMFMPLVAADRTRMRQYYALARKIATATGRKVRLVRLTCREVWADDVLEKDFPIVLMNG